MDSKSRAVGEAPWPAPAHEPLRSRIGDDLWGELVRGAPMVRAAAGSAIFSAGERPRLVAVSDGLVRLFTWTGDGRQVPLRHAPAGDLVGLGALLSGTEMLSSEVVTDTTLALLSIDHLRALASVRPELSWALTEQVSCWAMESVVTLLGAGFESMKVRVARHLLNHATWGADGQMAVLATHRALADAVGTAREVITRVLRVFRAEGFVDNRPGLVIVTEPEALARIARGATTR
jgi:CRP/FNR family cyclic AMP-dependent transcriptional regulator